MMEFIKMVYTDDLGHILSEASQAPYSDKEKYYSEIDSYLLNKSGLIEPISVNSSKRGHMLRTNGALSPF